jgi:DME family drug/metabolite transporter
MAGVNTNSLQGVALVLVAASLWGTTGTAQHLADGALAAAWIGALRLVVAALFFAALVRFVPQLRPIDTAVDGKA